MYSYSLDSYRHTSSLENQIGATPLKVLYKDYSPNFGLDGHAGMLGSARLRGHK